MTDHPTAPSCAIIDFNGVLGRQPTQGDWESLARSAAWPASLEQLQDAFWQRRPAFDLGAITAREFWAPLLAPGADMQRTIDVDAAMWLDVDPQVLGILQDARSLGLRLVMLSNAPRSVAQSITAAPWSQLFEALVFSCYIGANKPDPQAYQAALEAIGGPDPSDVVMVDDRRDNITSAVRLGLTGHHYQGCPEHLSRALLEPAAAPRRGHLQLVTSTP